jgi:hypothetical protein
MTSGAIFRNGGRCVVLACLPALVGCSGCSGSPSSSGLLSGTKWSVSIEGGGFPVQVNVDSELTVSVSAGGQFGPWQVGANVPVFTFATNEGRFHLVPLDAQFNADFALNNYLHRTWNSRDTFAMELGHKFRLGRWLMIEVRVALPGTTTPALSSALASSTFQDNKLKLSPLGTDWRSSRLGPDPFLLSLEHPGLTFSGPLLQNPNDNTLQSIQLYQDLWKQGGLKLSTPPSPLKWSPEWNLQILKSLPAYKGPAAGLAKEFHDNPDAAGKKYQGAKVRLEGRISSVLPSAVPGLPQHPLLTFVVLEGGWIGGPPQVWCTFEGNCPFSSQNVGHDVVIEGRCDGVFLDCLNIRSCHKAFNLAP